MIQHSGILYGFPVVYDEARCPTCRTSLRVWPSDHAASFSCSGCSGRKGRLRNNGCNLFRCFGCDYDLCLDCVKKWQRERAAFCEAERLRAAEAERQARFAQTQMEVARVLERPVVRPTPTATAPPYPQPVRSPQPAPPPPPSPPPSYDAAISMSRKQKN